MLKTAVLLFTVFISVVQCSILPRINNETFGLDTNLFWKIMKELTDPCASEPCENDGTCIATPDSFTCICKSPYFGKTCNEHPCEPNPCHNEGKCELDKEGFNCVCKFPFKGETCELDYCSPNPCEKDGICKLTGSSFNCTCKNPYHGNNCELGPCSPNPCKNGGECEENGKSFRCTCKYSFYGRTCELSPCEPNPCKNDGKCFLKGDDDFVCRCNEHFSGERCEKGPCSPNPCRNGGTCAVFRNATICVCRDAYFGEYCEKGDSTESDISTTPAISINTFSNSITARDRTEPDILTTPSTSINTFSDYITTRYITKQNITQITDSYNWTSSETSADTPDENATTDRNSTNSRMSTTLEQGICETDDYCLNGGTCRKDKEYEHICDCTENFGGFRCEVNLPCISLEQSCRIINAVCVIIDNHAICECPNGTLYHRKSGLCEDICDPRKCMHGKCEIIGKTYKCKCDQGYTGNHCDERERANHDNLIPWFTVIASINLLVCVLLILMFCVICQIKRLISSS